MLLDEPVGGMSHQETVDMMQMVSSLLKERERGILLIEHNMRAVMSCCDRIAVLGYGTKIAEGLPTEIRRNKEVIEAYLGEENRAA